MSHPLHPLARLAALLRAEGLSVLTYCGYTIETLRRGARADWNALLAVTDLLVDGPFLAARTGGAAGLAGSSNQRLHFLTSRYAHLRGELRSDPQRIEVRLGANGEILVNGVVSPGALEGDAGRPGLRGAALRREPLKPTAHVCTDTGGWMLYMVIEDFRGDPAPVYRRFRDRGRLAPEGLHYLGSWVTPDLERCYQVMECERRELLDEWIDQWKDLVDFEVIPVLASSEAAALIAPTL